MGLKKLDSEYKSHYKTMPVHRPVMTKAKVLSHPSDSAPEALESSRRAGLLSNQFSEVTEPALQRKRIVPYKYNHNIFATTTVKELADNEWLEAVGSDEESSRNHRSMKNGKKDRVETKKEVTEYSSHFAKQRLEKESPIMALANKTRTKKASKYSESQAKNLSSKTTERSPERLPPAGRPTYISDPHDKRLLRPSDGSAYLTFPDNHPRSTETEYSERYDSGVSKDEEKTVFKESSNIDADTYKKVLLHRSEAYSLPVSSNAFSVKKPSGNEKSLVSAKKSARKDRRNGKRTSLNSEESLSSVRSEKNSKEIENRSRKKENLKAEERLVPERTRIRLAKDFSRRKSSEEQSVSSVRSDRSLDEMRKPRGERIRETDKHRSSNVRRNKKTIKGTGARSRRQAWDEKPTPRDNEDNTDSVNCSTRGNRGSRGIRGDIVDRGRSPTPEMRSVGQSRRHHLDVTTGENNPLASGVDRFKTRVVGKGSEKHRQARAIYDPSRYSDVGESLSSSRSITSWTDRGSLDSESVAEKINRSKRSS